MLRPSRWPLVLCVLCVVPALASSGGSVESAEELYRAGAAALRAGDTSAALAALDRAAQLAPANAAVWLKLGLARAAARDWDGAIAAYRRVIEIDPSDARAYNNMANVHFRRGDLEGAAEAYGRALAIRPNYLLAAYHYGWMLRQLNRAEEAEQAFSRCLTLVPAGEHERTTQLECRFYLGALRYRARDWAAAAAAMEQVLSANPSHREAHHYLGMAYRRLGRPEAALQHLETHRQLLRNARSAEPIDKLDDP